MGWKLLKKRDDDDKDIEQTATASTGPSPPNPSGGDDPTPEPSVKTPPGPSVGGAEDWDEIAELVLQTPDGETVTIDMGKETEVSEEFMGSFAGRDITLEFELDGGITWTVNGQDIPTDLDVADLDLGASLYTKRPLARWMAGAM